MVELGISDDEFIRGKVPMTKQEIRVLTMVKAHISESDIVWDIGAGTGSMSIEAARMAPSGTVYAIERNAEGTDLIRKNMAKFGIDNITVIDGEAPDALRDIEDCDSVIIGGSGSRLSEILDVVSSRIKKGGRVVMNCITIQTIAAALAYLRAHAESFSYEAIQVQVNRLQAIGGYDMIKAVNPIYIITAQKI